MITYPNQEIVIIKKTPCKNNFLQINNEEWMTAAVDCGVSLNTFKIYLYLAANEVDYEKALSKEDIMKKLNMGSTSYYDGVKKLKKLGYLKEVGKNKLEFYTSIKKEENQNFALAENKKDVINSVSAENNKFRSSEKNQEFAGAKNDYEGFNFIF